MNHRNRNKIFMFKHTYYPVNFFVHLVVSGLFCSSPLTYIWFSCMHVYFFVQITKKIKNDVFGLSVFNYPAKIWSGLTG